MIRPFFRRRRERELDEEIRAHLEMAVEERVRRGEPRAEAERAVRREFGDPGRVREVTRRMWGGMWLDSLVQDLRFGGRSLRRSPGFATVAIGTIGLGVGACVTMFTIVNGVLLRPLPFPEPDRLVLLSFGPPPNGEATGVASWPTDQQVVEVRAHEELFEGATMFLSLPVTLTDAGDAVSLNSARIASDFTEIIGVSPILGRPFEPAEGVPGGPPVVAIGHGLWETRFGSDPNLIGRVVTLDGTERTVVAVMPAGFDFPEHADLWLPEDPQLSSVPTMTAPVVARLVEGISLEEADARFRALATASEFPALPSGNGAAEPLPATASPLAAIMVGNSSRPLAILTMAVGLVLLISCANVANLLLMRARTRKGEIGLRAALGAGQRRLLGQLLTESVLLSFIGGALGVVLALVGVHLIQVVAPAGALPRAEEIGVDGVALAFAVGLSLLTGLGFGLAPALWATGQGLRERITDGARTSAPRRGASYRAVVVAEISLSLALVSSAGLLIRSFQEIRRVDLGFRPEQLLAMTVDLPANRYPDAASVLGLHRSVLERMRRVPGLRAVAAVNARPLGPFSFFGDLRAENGADDTLGPLLESAVTPGYFQTMGIQVREGREFDAADRADAPGVVIVSRAIADRLWPNGDALGSRISLGRVPAGEDWRTVVGVVDDVVQRDILAEKRPTFYLPLEQMTPFVWLRHMDYIARSSSARSGVTASLRSVLREVDPSLPLNTITIMDDAVLANVGNRLFQTRVMGLFSALSLVLAAVGVYGVITYEVNERRGEIGVRIALGANRGDVLLGTVGNVLTLTLAGVVLGTLAGLAAASFLSPLLFGVTSRDPATFVSASLVMMAVAILSGLLPARSATRIDVAEVLRSG